ncbi:MAG TPA: flavodoxin-dependent (E)-4-hydroxy-3-methylbut-2-enyl-diphosphate synthase, partial [Acidobacteriota bacterium]
MVSRMTIQRKPTRKVKIGSIFVGEGEPIAVQSMCATRTQDIDATVQQAEQLRTSGAAIVRIAIDSDK